MLEQRRTHVDRVWTEPPMEFIEHDPSLLELLYVRSVWAIRSGVGLPPTEPVPPLDGTVAPGALTTREWIVQWEAAWWETWAWYRTRARWISGTTLGQRVGITVPLAPRRFSDGPARSAFDDAAFTRWMASIPRSAWSGWDERPDRTEAAVTAAAWSRGLRTIVVLPLVGAVARPMNEHCLLISSAVRDERPLFVEALGAFG